MHRPSRIVIASANPHKAVEIRQVLEELWGGKVELLARPDAVAEVEEDAPDFLGNAAKKARVLHRATGEAALADDSGLEVDGLVGRPGVRSARYAGPSADDRANRAKLVGELEGLPEDHPGRRARFRCVVVLAGPDGEVVGEGRVDGRITGSPRGENGFGYDPLFVPDEGDGRTFAEMRAEEKHALSHRGRALAGLAEALSPS